MITSIENMSLETRQNYDRLLKYLMNYAMFDCHIGIEFTDKLPPFAPSASYNTVGRLIIMNALWPYPTEIPFQLAHEIAHVLHEDQHYYNLNDGTANSGEASANIFAIKLLQKYCKENDYRFDTYYKFAQAFGIPKHVYYLLKEIA
ncbi:ImmA/IrrE family metallo-endopeptidase [Lactobacillus crispatus]|uniref:ImmA/IrrE family metallo-endopeptidase n=1 Tax=Lactobacillus crispatus TaxID=47770 RepID=UPI0015E00F00|nr:ImmA/IrrE family metallo-endopeptidase [Lactobacillus crispatus]QLK33403.1 ImmA/IrrE family metallo-endopeptidase [Lactobacillus crispatus]